jgi:hypothetical protein
VGPVCGGADAAPRRLAAQPGPRPPGGGGPAQSRRPAGHGGQRLALADDQPVATTGRRPRPARRAAAVGDEHAGPGPGAGPGVRGLQREQPEGVHALPASPRPGRPAARRPQPPPLCPAQAPLRQPPDPRAAGWPGNPPARASVVGLPVGRWAHPLGAGQVRRRQPAGPARDRRRRRAGSVGGATALAREPRPARRLRLDTDERRVRGGAVLGAQEPSLLRAGPRPAP